jgi:hypothetical protein
MESRVPNRDYSFLHLQLAYNSPSTLHFNITLFAEIATDLAASPGVRNRLAKPVDCGWIWLDVPWPEC